MGLRLWCDACGSVQHGFGGEVSARIGGRRLGMAPFTARADLPEPNDAGAALANGTLSAQTGASLYMMSSGAAATFAGPKLTIEYGVPGLTSTPRQKIRHGSATRTWVDKTT